MRSHGSHGSSDSLFSLKITHMLGTALHLLEGRQAHKHRVDKGRCGSASNASSSRPTRNDSGIGSHFVLQPKLTNIREGFSCHG